MRPGRLREIFDDAGNVVVAFDQQHVAGLGALARKRVGIARREGLVARHRLFEIAGDDTPDSVGHVTFMSRPHARVLRVFFMDQFTANSLQIGSGPWLTGA